MVLIAQKYKINCKKGDDMKENDYFCRNRSRAAPGQVSRTGEKLANL